MTIEEVREQAQRWGQLLRQTRCTAVEIEEIGRLSSELFMSMIKSDASAWTFDQIVLGVAMWTEEEEAIADVIGLFKPGCGL